MRWLRRVVVRHRLRARFRCAAIASAAVRPHGQSERAPPQPRCNALRHGSAASCMPGVSPGRRVARRARAAAASPFNGVNPPSGSMWPNVPSAGRLPARHRNYGGSGTGLRLAAPTSASACLRPAPFWPSANQARNTTTCIGCSRNICARTACFVEPITVSPVPRRYGEDVPTERPGAARPPRAGPPMP